MCRYYECRSMHKSWFSFGIVGIMSRGVTGVFPAHCVCVLWHDPLSSLWGFLFQKVFGTFTKVPSATLQPRTSQPILEARGEPSVTLKLRFPKWEWSWILYGIFFKRWLLNALLHLPMFNFKRWFLYLENSPWIYWDISDIVIVRNLKVPKMTPPVYFIMQGGGSRN